MEHWKIIGKLTKKGDIFTSEKGNEYFFITI